MHADTNITNSPTWNEHHQPLLNERDVPPRSTQVDARPPIPVRARMLWRDDGEEWEEGTAIAWTRPPARLVLVHFRRELRLKTLGAWLDASDVERL